MVRREDPKPSVGRPTEGTGSCCIAPADESSARVIAGEPGSRSPPEAERPTGEARCRKPLAAEAAHGKQPRGPQHEVKPAASSYLQSERRAEHVAAKATSLCRESGWRGGLGGVWGAAREEGAMGNTRGPSATRVRPRSCPDKPTVKQGVVQRESEGAVVVMSPVKNNSGGAKGPCFSHAVRVGKCEGMPETARANNPFDPKVEAKARRPSQPPLRVGAESWTQAPPRGLSASRMREIRTYGLNGGSASGGQVFNSHRSAGGRTYQ
jgi:hypothetical protein